MSAVKIGHGHPWLASRLARHEAYQALTLFPPHSAR
jgi:hypothetical protein